MCGCWRSPAACGAIRSIAGCSTLSRSSRLAECRSAFTTPSMRCRSSTKTSRAPRAPPGVEHLRAAVAVADGLLIATPEYNQALPGVVKNFVDWLSRGDESVLEGKPTAILGVTPGGWGTRLAQASLRHTLAACGALVMPAPQIYLRHAAQLFDELQRLVDPRARESLADYAKSFERWIRSTHQPSERKTA